MLENIVLANLIDGRMFVTLLIDPECNLSLSLVNKIFIIV
jgi:hypothetical protein